MALTAGFGMLLGRTALLAATAATALLAAAARVVIFVTLTTGFRMLFRATAAGTAAALLAALVTACHFLILIKINESDTALMPYREVRRTTIHHASICALRKNAAGNPANEICVGIVPS
jgi:hypothetical protein